MLSFKPIPRDELHRRLLQFRDSGMDRNDLKPEYLRELEWIEREETKRELKRIHEEFKQIMKKMQQQLEKEEKERKRKNDALEKEVEELKSKDEHVKDSMPPKDEECLPSKEEESLHSKEEEISPSKEKSLKSMEEDDEVKEDIMKPMEQEILPILVEEETRDAYKEAESKETLQLIPLMEDEPKIDFVIGTTHSILNTKVNSRTNFFEEWEYDSNPRGSKINHNYLGEQLVILIAWLSLIGLYWPKLGYLGQTNSMKVDLVSYLHAKQLNPCLGSFPLCGQALLEHKAPCRAHMPLPRLQGSLAAPSPQKDKASRNLPTHAI